MTEEVSKLFLEQLGSRILEILRLHDIPSELELSITSDVLFSVTAALEDEQFVSDGKLNFDDGLHELVFGFLEDWYQPGRETPNPQRMLFELEIVRAKGQVVETHFWAHWIDNPNLFKSDLEVAMKCRDIEEIDQPIPEKIMERFERRNKRAGNVTEIRIRLDEDHDRDEWISFSFPGNEFGNFENSLDGLYACILDMASKYS